MDKGGRPALGAAKRSGRMKVPFSARELDLIVEVATDIAGKPAGTYIREAALFLLGRRTTGARWKKAKRLKAGTCLKEVRFRQAELDLIDAVKVKWISRRMYVRYASVTMAMAAKKSARLAGGRAPRVLRTK